MTKQDLQLQLPELPDELMLDIFKRAKNPSACAVNKRWLDYSMKNSLFEEQVIKDLEEAQNLEKICNKDLYYGSVCRKHSVKTL